MTQTRETKFGLVVLVHLDETELRFGLLQCESMFFVFVLGSTRCQVLSQMETQKKPCRSKSSGAGGAIMSSVARTGRNMHSVLSQEVVAHISISYSVLCFL